MKVIVTTSANPLHYGHVSLYNEAVRIFGENNVKIVIGRNKNKDINFDKILYHITPYRVNCEIVDNITLADYCKNNGVSYLVRGIRNAVDAEYELKLDFLNKEINSNIQTMFFPTKDMFSNISSSSINELLKYNKYDVVKKYMNEDAMYRYVEGKPKYVVFFGKSCIGKTFFLENIAFKDNNIKVINVDNIFWDVFRECYGEGERLKIQSLSKNSVYEKNKQATMEELIDKYSTNEYWNTFFEYITNKFDRYNIKKFTRLDIKDSVYLLDFPAIGSYWRTIPVEARSKIYLISLVNSDENRKKFMQNRHFENKINDLDLKYKDPDFFDEKINISTFCKLT